MIKLVIRNNKVVDYGSVDADWTRYGDQYDVVDWDGDTTFLRPTPIYNRETHPLGPEPQPPPTDPRTAQQKADDLAIKHMYLRKRAYPKFRDIVAIVRDDFKFNQKNFADLIDLIDANFPPP